MAVFKDCHQISPKVLLKWWLSFKIVIKHRPKFYWSDGCLSRLSSNIVQSSIEVMAVDKDYHQTSPKVVLKWWLSFKIVIKHRPKFYWSDGCLERLLSNIAQSSTEVMAIFQDCHQTSPKVLLKWWLSERLEKRLLKVLLKWWLSERLEKRLLKVLLKWWLSQIQEQKSAEKRLLIKIVWKGVKIYSFLSGAQGSHLWIWQPSRHFVRVGRSKLR